MTRQPVKVQHPNTLLRWYGDALMWVATKLIHWSANYATYYEWQVNDTSDDSCCTDCNCQEE